MKQSSISAAPIKEANPESVDLNGQKGANLDRVTIEQCDFDEAVKFPWSTSTCIAAQMALRVFGRPLHGEGEGYDRHHSLTEFGAYTAHPVLGPIVEAFDKNHFNRGRPDAVANLQALRASLPITITLP